MFLFHSKIKPDKNNYCVIINIFNVDPCHFPPFNLNKGLFSAVSEKLDHHLTSRWTIAGSRSIKPINPPDCCWLEVNQPIKRSGKSRWPSWQNKNKSSSSFQCKCFPSLHSDDSSACETWKQQPAEYLSFKLKVRRGDGAINENKAAIPRCLRIILSSGLFPFFPTAIKAINITYHAKRLLSGERD